MNSIKSFAISFCVVCVVVGALTLIFPNKKSEKSLKFAVSIAFLFFIISSTFLFGKIDFSDKFDFTENQFENISVENVKLIFETALKSGNINYSDIEIITDKNDSGSIIISKIIVYSNDDTEKIKSAIGNDENYEVEIINE